MKFIIEKLCKVVFEPFFFLEIGIEPPRQLIFSWFCVIDPNFAFSNSDVKNKSNAV